jgi:HK97 family phage major capsid protein
MEKKELEKVISETISKGMAPVIEKLEKVEDKKGTTAELTNEEFKSMSSAERVKAFSALVEEGKVADAQKVSKELGYEEEAFLFLKAVRDGDRMTVRALNTGTDADGGYLVPEAWASQIDNELREQGITRQYADVRFMPEGTLNLPKGDANVTAYWVAEGNTITESNRTYGNTKLSAEKLAAISTMTTELREDTIADVVRDVTSNIVESIALKEDDAMINGDGTASFGNITGVLQDANVTDVVMGTGDVSFANVDADDIKDLYYGVPHQKRTNAAFLMSDYVLSLIDSLKDSQNRPLYRGLNDSESGILLGKPVVISNQAPELADDGVSTPFIAFGDFGRGVVLGDRRRITINQSDSAVVGAGNMFTEDKIALKVTERIDIAVHLPGYLARLTTAAA